MNYFNGRHEVKYFINRREAFLLEQMLRQFMHTDLNAGEKGEYFIRSLYFDSHDNKDYLDKISGFSQRKKTRIRIYNTEDLSVKLELKYKQDKYIHKETVQIDRLHTYDIMKGNNDILLNYDNAAAHKIYTIMQTEKLRPVILIDYERHAFTYPFDNIRITIDKNVRASMDPWKLFEDDISMVPVICDQRYILEVKFKTMLPNFLRKIISTVNPQLTSISKYCLARQAISI